MDDDRIAQAIRNQSSIGIAGPAQAFPYAYNRADLPMEFGVEFTPLCAPHGDTPGAQQPVITKIGITPAARRAPGLKPGKSAKVSLRGSGDGAVEVSAIVDGVQCGSRIQATLTAGKGSLKLAIPRSARRSMKLSSGTASRAIRFKTGVRTRVDRALKACEELVRSTRITRRLERDPSQLWEL
jgi:hypothetical protein